jgi:indolepyruvate decarboxylase
MKRILGFLITIITFFSIEGYANPGFNQEDTKGGTRRMTVASYLQKRLEDLGLKRIFGVAGNYTAPFLDTILEDKSAKIQITGTSNELCAGYAADGYSRIQGEKGLGAVAVTYGVGSFSLLNAVAGSFVEKVPVVVINGAPTNKEFAGQKFIGHISSHMLPDVNSNINVFRNVTVAAERITNADQAQTQIDASLAACITRRQPVYLEVLEDVWRTNIDIQYPLQPLSHSQKSITVSDARDAVEATLKLIRQHVGSGKAKPMFWAGVEIQRFGLQRLLLDLIDASGFEYTTSVLGKSVISEDTPGFSSVGLPKNASCVIGLGAWTTDKDVGNNPFISDHDKALIAQDSAFVGGAFFSNVSLQVYMEHLLSAFQTEQTRKSGLLEFALSLGKSASFLEPKNWASSEYPPSKVRLKDATPDAEVLDYDSFFQILNDSWVSRKDGINPTVVVDASFPLVAAQSGLHISCANGFVAQADWLSIGYASPASIGIKCALDDNNMGNKRVIVVAGDGAFQVSCQAVSSIHHLKHNTVVFILDNGIYGIEQRLVNPNPFRESPVPYPDPILNNVYKYNELTQWHYEKLVDVFGGGVGRVVENQESLKKVISEIKQNEDKFFIVTIKIPKYSTPSLIKDGLKQPGEDETSNPQWPPKAQF